MLRKLLRPSRSTGSQWYRSLLRSSVSTILKINVKKSTFIDRYFSCSEIFKFANYWLIFYVWVVGCLCMTLIATFQDAICHQILGEDGDQQFGAQRLWGSVGWGISALFTGYLVDAASDGKLLFDYSIAFKIMFVCFLADFFLIYRKLQVRMSSE